MDEQKYWMKFICSGKAEDYLRYANAKKSRENYEGEDYAVYNRGAGYSGIEYRGERPSGHTSHT